MNGTSDDANQEKDWNENDVKLERVKVYSKSLCDAIEAAFEWPSYGHAF